MTPEQPSAGEWVLADAFDRAAPTYDAMVALSPGYHDQLRGAADALVRRVRQVPPERPGRPAGAARDAASTVLLDLGCGSGASTRAVLDAWAAAGGGQHELTLRGIDASEGMVAQARAKQWPTTVELVVSDAVAHLEGLPSGSVDGVLAAYLLRNVRDRDRLVDEVARVLRPGGTFAVHDYSVADSLRARATWAVVCHAVIIPLARVKGSDVPLHRYLYSSVRDFDSVPRISRRLRDAGMVDIVHRSYTGWQHGIVHTVVGSSPSSWR